MTVEENPYWMKTPNKKVKARLEKIRNVASTIERTVRRITYMLYPKLKGKRLERSYNTTIKDVVRARILGIVPWENIRESRTKFVSPRGRDDVQDYLDSLIRKDLAKDYYLDRRPAHKHNFLVWFEKETVLAEFESKCYKYDAPYLCGRGQATWTRKYKMAVNKLDDSWTILYFGDNDDKGHEIYDVIQRDLHYLGCRVKMEWVMVTEEQERKYDLPEGARIDVFELEDLENEIEDIITEHIDLEKYNEIVEQEKKDREKLMNYKLILKKIKSE